MPSKNIFKAKKLELNYEPETSNKKPFVLKKNGGGVGRRYDARGASNLINSILTEREKPEHDMSYALQSFTVSREAQNNLEILTDN